MSNVAAIVQARLGSSRLPAKVLADLGGDSMLARVVQRLRATQLVNQVVIATTDASQDDAVADEAARLDAGCYRGPEHDVLARYVGAARECGADVIVRITSDCPLIDPDVVDRVIDALTRSRDYASNTHVRTYPRGLDVEAFHASTLERIARLATSAAAHEHVTSFVMEQPSLFSIRHVVAGKGIDGRDPSPAGSTAAWRCGWIDDSDLRWTVDTPEDLAVVRALYARSGNDIVPYRELVATVRKHPELAAANAHVVQKSWTRVA